MRTVFSLLGYSKQAFHQKFKRQQQQLERHDLLMPVLKQLRQEHPGIAARELYKILQPAQIGRDRFERLAFDNGLRLGNRRSVKRTTDSTGIIRFPNLVLGRKFTAINQAWASDITYYEAGMSCYYLTFVVDLYSRKIVGYCSSERLLTEQTTLPALRMALATRKPPPGLIFHSDGGGQYYHKAFLELTGSYQIKNSMCDMAYENPYAERVNGTIKNQYLCGYNPTSYRGLTKALNRAVYNYNNVRPHSSINSLTPNAYEAAIAKRQAFIETNDFCDGRSATQQRQKNHSSQ